MVAEFTKMKKNHVFHCDIWLLWNVFAVLNFTNVLMLKNLTVRWLLVYELRSYVFKQAS